MQNIRHFYKISQLNIILLVVLFFVPLFYSEGLKNRTILIHNDIVKSFAYDGAVLWHELVFNYHFDMPYSALSKYFLLIKEFRFFTPPPAPVIPVDAPVRTYSEEKPLRVLLVGDSMAMIMVYAFKEDFLKQEKLDFRTSTKVSSGLSLPEFFNWQEKLREELNKKTYDLILIHIGANDAQSLIEGDKRVIYPGEEWNEIYRKRVQSFAKAAVSTGSQVYWIALPPMRGYNYHRDIQTINSITEKVCGEENIKYISLNYVLGDETGKYTDVKNFGGSMVMVRQEDGIHANGYGSYLIREEVLRHIKKDFTLLPAK